MFLTLQKKCLKKLSDHSSEAFAMPFLKKFKKVRVKICYLDETYAGPETPKGPLGEGGGEDPWYKGPPGHVRASHSPALGHVYRNTV
jgi:hypothetical protein